MTTDWAVQDMLQDSLTAGRLTDLLRMSGPATAMELARATGLDVSFYRARSSSFHVARKLRRLWLDNPEVVRRHRSSNTFEYALKEQIERNQGPVYDHGGWE